MARFTYSVHTREGQRQSGLVEAPDRLSALRLLSEKHALVTHLKPVDEGGWVRLLAWLGIGSIQTEDLLAVTQELAVVTASGMPLVQALDVIIEDTQNVRMRGVLVEVAAAVRTGGQLATALKAHPSVFSGFYCGLVEAGEASGNLPHILDRLADYLQLSDETLGKLRAALYYPATILAFSGLLLALMMGFGVPRLEEMYSGLGAALPGPTWALVTGVRLAWQYWPLMLLGLVALAALIRWALTREALVLDAVKLRLPLFGPMLRELAVARFAASLSTLHRSGVPILQALELVANTCGNAVYARAVMKVRERVQGGGNLADPLRDSQLFPAMATGMVASGEATGSLDAMLERLAVFYQTRVDTQLRALTSLLEPLLLMIVGVMLGAVIIVLVMPFFQLSSLI